MKITRFNKRRDSVIIALSKQTTKRAFMNTNIATTKNVETMSSTQLAVMLGYEKKEVNKKIRAMFSDKMAGEVISLTLRANGQIDEYNLPELESKMFVAKHDISYLEEITQFWINGKNNQPLAISQDDQLLQLAQGVIRLTAERDEAIKNKSLINDKRTATLMNKASQDSKRIKSLESKLQDVGNYQSLIAAQLPQRIETELNDNAQTWRVLVKISKEMNLPPKKVIDERYGAVNTYHVDVINKFIEEYL